jgi:hypothetical protein
MHFTDANMAFFSMKNLAISIYVVKKNATLCLIIIIINSIKKEIFHANNA